MFSLVLLATVCCSSIWALPECPAVDGPDSVYFAHENCSQFWQCSNGVPYLFNCSANLHWNPTINTCDYPDSAGCATEVTSETLLSSTSSTNISSTKSSLLLTTPKPNSSSKNSSGLKCPEVDGPDSVYFAHENCSQFWQCSNGVPYLFNCSANLHWNPTINTCDYPDNAGCATEVTSETLLSSTLATNIPTAKSPLLSTTPKPKNSFTNSSNLQCPEVDGPDSVYFANENCSQFWQCSNGVAYLFNCSANLHWNPTINTCDYPDNAGCATEVITETLLSTTSSTNNYSTKSSLLSTTPKPDSSSKNSSGLKCPEVDGPDSVYFAHENCSQFWQCSNGVLYLFNCSANLHWNPTINTCDYPNNAGCLSSESSSTSSSVSTSTTEAQSKTTVNLPSKPISTTKKSTTITSTTTKRSTRIGFGKKNFDDSFEKFNSQDTRSSEEKLFLNRNEPLSSDESGED